MPPNTRSPATMPPVSSGSSSRNPPGGRRRPGNAGRSGPAAPRRRPRRRAASPAVRPHCPATRGHRIGGRPDAETDATEEGDAQQELDDPEGARESGCPLGAADDCRPRRRSRWRRATRARRCPRSARARGCWRTSSGGCTGRIKTLTIAAHRDQQQEAISGNAATPSGASSPLEPQGEGEVRGHHDPGEIDDQQVAPADVTGGTQDRPGGSPGLRFAAVDLGVSGDGADHRESRGLTDRRTANAPPCDVRLLSATTRPARASGRSGRSR